MTIFDCGRRCSKSYGTPTANQQERIQKRKESSMQYQIEKVVSNFPNKGEEPAGFIPIDVENDEQALREYKRYDRMMEEENFMNVLTIQHVSGLLRVEQDGRKTILI